MYSTIRETQEGGCSIKRNRRWRSLQTAIDYCKRYASSAKFVRADVLNDDGVTVYSLDADGTEKAYSCEGKPVEVKFAGYTQDLIDEEQGEPAIGIMNDLWQQEVPKGMTLVGGNRKEGNLQGVLFRNRKNFFLGKFGKIRQIQKGLGKYIQRQNLEGNYCFD